MANGLDRIIVRLVRTLIDSYMEGFETAFPAVVKKVNGEEYAGQAKGTGVLKNLSRLTQRNTVIEEFTGTWCGYCPRGKYLDIAARLQ